MTNVASSKKARLSKMYTLKREVTFTDESGDFSLFIRKATPVETRDSIQNSLKVRAMFMALENEPSDNPLKIGYADILEGIGLDNRDSLIEYICNEDVLKLRISIEERVAFDDRWAKDDYINSLQEAWEDGMREKWMLDNDDPEASLVFNALKKFTDEVEELFIEELEDIYASKEDWSDQKLMDAAVNKFIKRHASSEQATEQNKWKVYYCTYTDENCTDRFFESRDEVDSYPDLFARLIEEYDEMSLDSLEGKD